MDSKFIYFKKRLTFDSIKESFPANLSPLCFIEDTNEIWFNEHFFQAGHESISISEMDNIVTVSLSEDSFNIIPGSESISVSKGQGKNIVISCNALTRIETDSHLEWRDGKLWHADSGILAGSYGNLANTLGTNIVKTLNIDVDSAGHITNIITRDTTVRDYVEQKATDSSNSDRLLLLAEKVQENDDTNVARKASATFNNSTGELTTPKMRIIGVSLLDVLIVDNGNIKVTNGYIEGNVRGDIEGYATPKIHISENPNYGGASLNTYGHVKLVDEINGVPEESSSNQDTTNTNVKALAASPYAVYKYFLDNKMIVRAVDYNANLTRSLSREWLFGDDFHSNSNVVEISWKEY